MAFAGEGQVALGVEVFLPVAEQALSDAEVLAAASAKLRPCSVTSLTASTLNSLVNVRRGLPIIDLLTKSLHSFLSAHHSWGSPQVVSVALAQPRP
jgi:hypothetical protein